MKNNYFRYIASVIVICIAFFATMMSASAETEETKLKFNAESNTMPFTNKVVSWYENAFSLFQPLGKSNTVVLSVPMIGAIFDSPREGVKVAIIKKEVEEFTTVEETTEKDSSTSTTRSNPSKSVTQDKPKITGVVTNKPAQKPNPKQPETQKPAANPKPEEKPEEKPAEPTSPTVEEDPPIDTSIEELEDELPPVEHEDPNP